MRRVLSTCGLLLSVAQCLAAPASEYRADSALVEQGYRIYAEGVLPDGRPLTAVRPEGFELKGRQAACIVCHRTSGMGSVEGSIDSSILVPPVAGPVLFAPSRFASSYLDQEHHYVPTKAWERTLTRPAYDRDSLAHALRQGLDPGGRTLVAPMPRYALDDAAVTALAAYLGSLGARQAPGVSETTLQLATVVSPAADPGDVDAMLAVLRAWEGSARGAGRRWRLHVWRLSGPASTWQAQLDSFYRKQPVFALLSGIGTVDWAPVHRFCERQRIACMLPAVELIPDVGDDFYSLYFSSGVQLEARILARFLAQQDTAAGRGRIIQVYADATGERAAMQLRERLGESNPGDAIRRYRVSAPRAALRDVSADDRLVLWLRPPQIAALLTALPEGPAADPVYVSGLLATPGVVAWPAHWKTRVNYVSLFDDLGLQGDIARLRLQRWLRNNGLDIGERQRLQADAYAACYLFNKALAEMRDQEVRRPEVPLTREHLLETLETLVDKYNDSTGLINTDSHVAYYGRMSLGPEQRIAVRGGSILRYASPGSPRLVPVGARIVP